jgi:hypothetical protein
VLPEHCSRFNVAESAAYAHQERSLCYAESRATLSLLLVYCNQSPLLYAVPHLFGKSTDVIMTLIAYPGMQRLHVRILRKCVQADHNSSTARLAMTSEVSSKAFQRLQSKWCTPPHACQASCNTRKPLVPLASGTAAHSSLAHFQPDRSSSQSHTSHDSTFFCFFPLMLLTLAPLSSAAAAALLLHVGPLQHTAIWSIFSLTAHHHNQTAPTAQFSSASYPCSHPHPCHLLLLQPCCQPPAV